MQKKETNRANHLPVDSQYIKGVKLIDVDTTIADYMVSVIIPEVEENGKKIKVPLNYGNAERWNSARRNGYLRDVRGRVEIPLVMFKRNSVERDSSLQHFKDGVTMPAYQKYSKKNRYERFSLQNGVRPIYELYNVAMPSYVTVTYEVMIWTSFTEHMNKIVEAFQYATDRYWGKEDGYKFRARIDSFDTAQEVAEGSERVIRTTFTISVNAYLLAEVFDNQPTVKKEFTKKRVVFGVETDLTGASGDLFTQPSLYNEYKEVIDFVAVRGSQQAVFVNSTTAKLINVRKPLLPSELSGVFDVVNWFRIYINGDFISPSLYNYSYNGQLYEIVFNFSNLSFPIDENDEILITGKFQEL
jgi:hypothetical protein